MPHQKQQEMVEGEYIISQGEMERHAHGYHQEDGIPVSKPTNQETDKFNSTSSD